MKIFYDQTAEVTAKELQVNPSTGLTSEEAEKRSKQYGFNRLEGGKEKSIFQMMLEQLKDFLVIILMIAQLFPLHWENHLRASLFWLLLF